MNFLKKALEIDQKIDNKKDTAIDIGNIGVIYKKLGEIDKAEEYFRDSLKIQTELGFKEGIAYQTYNMGTIYELRGDKERALEAFDVALKLADEVGVDSVREVVLKAVGELNTN
jgi:tetratricopeptide (TPR) repeat protein